MPVGGSAGQVLTKVTATNYDTNWQMPAAGLTLPLTQNLTFSPDNTYDIGASSANRPRNAFVGTTVQVGTRTGTWANNTAWAGSQLVFTAPDPQSDGTPLMTLAPFNDSAHSGYYALALTDHGSWRTQLFMIPDPNQGSGTNFQLFDQADSANTSVLQFWSSGSISFRNYGTASNGFSITVGGNVVVAKVGATTNGIGIGLASNSLSTLGVQIAPDNISNPAIGVQIVPKFNSNLTTAPIGLDITYQGDGTTYTLPAMYLARISTPAVNVANLTVTTTYGLFVQNLGAANRTNVYGVYIAAQSGATTTNMGIFNAGTAEFDGSIGFGGAPSTTTGLRIVHNAIYTSNIQYGVYVLPTFTGPATGSLYAVYSGVSAGSAGSAYTTSAAYCFYAATSAMGTNCTITTIYGMYVSNQGRGQATNCYGLYINAQSASPTSDICLFLGTPSGGTTNIIINSTVGATLTTAGAWTSAPSWARQKADIRAAEPEKLDRWFNWLSADLRPVSYRYPLVLDANGEPVGPYTQDYEYDHFGFLLDDVPDEIRQVWCSEASGSISHKDTEGFLLAMLKVSGQRIKGLEARLAALEAA